MKTKHEFHFSDRERFNWGYWDGRHDQERGQFAEWTSIDGKAPHPFDPVYGAGYWAGRTDYSKTDSSETAWTAYDANRIRIGYAYPTSPRGGKGGGYYRQGDDRAPLFDDLEQAIYGALEYGRPVVLAFGEPERADDFRHLGVTHALDGRLIHTARRHRRDTDAPPLWNTDVRHKPRFETCFYDPTRGQVIDVINPVTGLGLYGKRDLANAQAEYGPEVFKTSLDDATERAQAWRREHICKPPRPITKAQFWDALEQLFPEDWQHGGGGESFKFAEHTCAEITDIFARIGESYFTLTDRADMKHTDILAACRKAAEQPQEAREQ